MTDVRARIPRLTLFYELADGTAGEETIINPTFVAFERAKANRDWPDGKVILYTFCLWHQLKAKQLTDVDFETFRDHDLHHVADQLMDDEETELPAVDPTPPDPESGWPV